MSMFPGKMSASRSCTSSGPRRRARLSGFTRRLSNTISGTERILDFREHLTNWSGGVLRYVSTHADSETKKGIRILTCLSPYERVFSNRLRMM